MAAQPQLSNPSAQTCLLIVMGVSGSGKTTLAQQLAAHYGYRFLDGDDFHSDEARARMARGEPLTDAMRQPWVENMCKHLHGAKVRGEHSVLAFSGLRKAHRQAVRDVGLKTLVLFLDGDEALIQQRANLRQGHFADPRLVHSQFESLEDPRSEADVCRIDVHSTQEQVFDQALAMVERFLPRQPSLGNPQAALP